MARTRIPLSAADEALRDQQEKLELSTAEIGLTVRTTNCLEERGIFTVRDLLNTTRAELLSITNFGEKTLDEVYRALERVGFYRPSRAGQLPAGKLPFFLATGGRDSLPSVDCGAALALRRNNGQRCSRSA
ncbi:MAG: hypothetical protein LW697_14485 [Blastopirellula sp.]|nr:hypothetical protein [Blastopirellula sp.]